MNNFIFFHQWKYFVYNSCSVFSVLSWLYIVYNLHVVCGVVVVVEVVVVGLSVDVVDIVVGAGGGLGVFGGGVDVQSNDTVTHLL